MKKIIVLGLVVLLLMSSIAAAGIWDSLTGDATADTAKIAVSAKPGFFARLVSLVKPAPQGDKYTLPAGEDVRMCGHNVLLEFVGAGGAQVKVDSDSKYVNKGASLAYGGVKVSVLEANAPERTAVLALLCISSALNTEEEAVESEESAEVAEEATEESEEALALEKCSVSSARFCYLGASAEFDEEDVFSCMRTQACAGIEEELAAGGAELALSEISEKDIACYKRCLVDLKCYIKELDVCWHPESYGEIGAAPLVETEESETTAPSAGRAVGVLKGCTVINIVSEEKTTGDKICGSAGYPLCVNVLQDYSAKYFESNDKSCKGLQYFTSSSTLVTCSESVVPSYDDCYQVKGTPVENLAEPLAGDMTAARLYQAVCCK